MERRLRALEFAALLAIAAVPVQAREWRELRTPNEGSVGIFDPSLAVDPEISGRLWLAHSIVEEDSALPGARPHTVSIGLSFRDADGAWQSAPRRLSQAEPVTLDGTRAVWQSEVGSLVRDPGAPPEARWKLFYHQYLSEAGKRRFEHGWIALRSAASPAALAEAIPEKLMTGRGYDPVSDQRGGTTRSPIGVAPSISVHQHFDALRDCAALTEPGAFATEDALWLALVCAEKKFLRPVRMHVALLRCDQPCDPSRPGAWRATRVLSHEDARPYDAKGFSAPALVPSPDGLEVWVTPTRNRPFPDAYAGCVGFRFDPRGALEGRPGPPRAVFEITEDDAPFFGACDGMVASGRRTIFLGRLFPQAQRQFRLFVTAPAR